MNDSPDITQRRIDSNVTKLLASLAVTYEKANPRADFWPIFEKEEKALDEKLRKRPIMLMEIETACATFRSNVIKALA